MACPVIHEGGERKSALTSGATILVCFQILKTLAKRGSSPRLVINSILTTEDRAMLPQKIVKKPKQSGRWRSQAHCNFVRSFACSVCSSQSGIEVCHVRNGSDAGMGRKPSDFFTVSLCKVCHTRQHSVGERTFWAGRDVEALIAAFIAASPKRREIQDAMRERGL